MEGWIFRMKRSVSGEGEYGEKGGGEGIGRGGEEGRGEDDVVWGTEAEERRWGAEGSVDVEGGAGEREG